ncbi:hypothetical protein EN942_17540, partial [Mesorhizobium sp. M7A.F.Ca.CA.001.14.1.1]
MSTAERPSDNSSRILVLAGGFCGAAGVALSAAAAHLGGAFVGTAASFLLMHAQDPVRAKQSGGKEDRRMHQ